MVFVQHLLGFGGRAAGRALMIDNLLPALESLSTAFGRIRPGIHSTSPILLLDAGCEGNAALLDSFGSRRHTLTCDIGTADFLDRLQGLILIF